MEDEKNKKIQKYRRIPSEYLSTTGVTHFKVTQYIKNFIIISTEEYCFWYESTVPLISKFSLAAAYNFIYNAAGLLRTETPIQHRIKYLTNEMNKNRNLPNVV